MDTSNDSEVKGKAFLELQTEVDQLKKEKEIEYLAGFFDGEGSINITSRDFAISVSVSNTSYASLEYFRKVFGGRICKVNMAKVKESESYKRGVKSGCYSKSEHKQKWQWRLSDRYDAQRFLKKMEPYLRLKKPQARLGIEYIRNFRGTQRVRVSEYELKKREEYRSKMEKMNASLNPDKNSESVYNKQKTLDICIK